MRQAWRQKQNAGSAMEVSGVHPVVARILQLRGVTGEEEAKLFLNPEYKNSHDPFLLSDMERAVSRILRAIEKQENITVYADYDADAVTAAAVLLRFFRALGYSKADYYIPDRFSEGYGVNEEAIRALSESGTRLVITVDCGINSVAPVLEANRLGMDVVITDHHQLTGDLPEALAVVNPHRPDDKYPFKDLTGVGVAFKLVQALVARLKIKDYRLKIPTEGWEKWLLDLVAIGTVADCQSLQGENRIFVKWGLYVLQKTKWKGLKQLIELSGADISRPGSYILGFQLAPRINAAGRIRHASEALELLLTDDEGRGRELAGRLEELNRQRQGLTEQILSEAREQAQTQSGKKVVLAVGENWPRGVLGLVAGKLTEELYRPVLVLDKSGGEAVGSARSISAFNIISAISESGEHLLRYGGHAQAAGFTLSPERIESFHLSLLRIAEESISENDLQKLLWYDCELKLEEINEALVEQLERLEPHGVGNPRPRFRINDLLVADRSPVGQEGRHLRARFSRDGSYLSGIAFSQGFWAERLVAGSSRVDLIGELGFNEWNGTKSIQVKIVDINLHG